MLSLCLLLTFNGIGAYIAYRLITWFETGRTEVEPLLRPNVKRVK